MDWSISIWKKVLNYYRPINNRWGSKALNLVPFMLEDVCARDPDLKLTPKQLESVCDNKSFINLPIITWQTAR